MSAEELNEIAWERQIGFLHLMQPIIRILGFGITSYVPLLHQVILTMLNHAQNIRSRSSEVGAVEVIKEYDDEEEQQNLKDVTVTTTTNDASGDDDDAVSRRHRDEAQALRVRSLCLLRIAGKHSFLFSCTIFCAVYFIFFDHHFVLCFFL